MLPFVKLQGAGNDYIAIDGRNKNYDWNQLSIDMRGLKEPCIKRIGHNPITQTCITILNNNITEQIKTFTIRPNPMTSTVEQD